MPEHTINLKSAVTRRWHITLGASDKFSITVPAWLIRTLVQLVIHTVVRAATACAQTLTHWANTVTLYIRMANCFVTTRVYIHAATRTLFWNIAPITKISSGSVKCRVSICQITVRVLNTARTTFTAIAHLGHLAISAPLSSVYNLLSVTATFCHGPPIATGSRCGPCYLRTFRISTVGHNRSTQWNAKSILILC